VISPPVNSPRVYIQGVGKKWNLEPCLWRHRAAAAQTDDPTALKESTVWAAAARWRQSLDIWHSFSTPYPKNAVKIEGFYVIYRSPWKNKTP